MLSSETVVWIEERVKNIYPKNKLEASLQALSQFLDLTDDNNRSIATIMEGMRNATDQQKPLLLREFADIERFMKDLLKLVQPSLLSSSPSGFREWTLRPLYTQAFHLFEETDNLSSLNLKELLENGSNNRPYYQRYFHRVYRFRNPISHGENVVLTPDDVLNVTASMLVCELHLCYTKRDAIARLWDQRDAWDAFHREDYCRKITQAYDALCKQGFGYLDVHWYADSDANTTGLTIDSLRRQTSDHLLKLLGEAGTGKSTSLKQMEYLMAKELAGKSRGMIPVLIELGHLSDEDRPVLSRAARQLNIGESRLSVLLTGGNICLLLDGFNEILDLMLKKKIAKELELLAARYPASRILLTDRALARATIPTLPQARRLYLSPITMQARQEYFRRNCPDATARELILNKTEEDPAYFESLDTPLKLKQLVDVAVSTHTVPEDLLHSYVQLLMEREQNEKKDPNIEYLNVFLQALALQFQDEFSMLKAQKQLAKCKMALGYTQPDTLQCLKLALDMGLLVSEETNVLRFASPEYQEYFACEAEASDLISVLD